MIIYIILAILWITVSLHIINCINDNGSQGIWDTEPMYKKIFYVAVTPMFYVFLGLVEAFKK